METSDSSDEADMIGSPKRTRPARAVFKPLPDDDDILSGSVRSASYNIVFQVMIRVFTFGLNAFILRYVSHDVLGICNVRLALLYSTILFLSREPFRRAALRKSETDSWAQTINLIWFVVPNTVFWSILGGSIWCYVLSQPGSEGSDLTSQYRSSVVLVCLATVIESVSEVPYIIGQYFMFYRLRIIGDTSLIAVRSMCLAVAVVFFPSSAIFAYAVGSVGAAFTVLCIYYGCFTYFIHYKKSRFVPFESLTEFLPSSSEEETRFSPEMKTVAWSFYQQGILKQFLTEGERYLMTFFDILTFEEQGVYDLVSNLGSLAARFVFLPIEESAYFYFAQTLQRKCYFLSRDEALAVRAAYVLSNLVRLMLLIGAVMLVYGVPYSNTVLYLYGGENLSDKGPGTKLLQANCFYIAILALNGVTEAFAFAAMSQEELDKFNKKLVIFSAIFLLCSYILTSAFGSIGFYMANSLNMALRIGHSAIVMKKVFVGANVDPFEFWLPKRQILMSFFLAFLGTFSAIWIAGRLLALILGLIIFAINAFVVFTVDKDLINFFIRLYKTKTV